VQRDRGQPDEAAAYAEQAWVIAEAMASPELTCAASAARAGVRHDAGDAQAIAEYERAVECAREAGDRLTETEMLIRLADAHADLGDPRQADDLARRALEYARDGRYRMFEGQALTVLAALCLDRGDAVMARELAGEATRVQAATGHRLGRERAEAITARADERLATG
jgi:tetratricopeptide (TPR) repeat protein